MEEGRLAIIQYQVLRYGFQRKKVLNPGGKKTDSEACGIFLKICKIFFDNILCRPIISAEGFVIGCSKTTAKGLAPQRAHLGLPVSSS
jgi:hypothetical protein